MAPRKRATAGSLSAADIRKKVLSTKPKLGPAIECAHWDTTLYPRLLSMKEAAELQEKHPGEDAPLEAHIRFLAETMVTCLCSSDGDRVFTDEDVELLMDQPLQVIQELTAPVLAANGLGTDVVAAAKNA